MSVKQDRLASGDPAPEPREATRLESDDEIRQALQARRVRLAVRTPTARQGVQRKIAAAEPAEIEAQPDRPLLRPPTGMLCVLDDGKLDGEWVRLRADRFAIGRTDGDVRIPHDGLISSRHAELVRQHGPSGFHWVLIDLQSTNGTFVRIGSSVLRNESEVIIGSGRYRFEGGTAHAPRVDPAGSPPQTTQAWSGPAPVQSLVPALVELSPAGPVNRTPLTLPEYWIGRDAKACVISRPDDMLVNGRHARLYRDAKARWHIENNKSFNGIWLRIAEPMPLGSACQFRVGEQRFIFRVN